MPQLTPDSVTPPQRENRWSFSLAALLTLVTYCAVSLGVTLVAPGIGIALLVIAGPAIVRAAMLSKRWRQAGHAVSAGQQALTFAGSVVVVATIAVASSAAFVAVCFPLGGVVFEGVPPPTAVPMFFGAWALGIAAGLLVGGILLYRLWIAYLYSGDWATPPNLRQRVMQFADGVVYGLTPIAGALAGVGIVAAGLQCWWIAAPPSGNVWTPVPLPGAEGQIFSYAFGVVGGLAGLAASMGMTRRSLPAKIVLVSSVATGMLGAVLGFSLQFSVWPGTLLSAPEALQSLVFSVIGCVLGVCVSGLMLAAYSRRRPPNPGVPDRAG